MMLRQMGINNAELFNNLGLCCFYAQQYDMALACMERALALATEDTLGEEDTGLPKRSSALTLATPQPRSGTTWDTWPSP